MTILWPVYLASGSPGLKFCNNNNQCRFPQIYIWYLIYRVRAESWHHRRLFVCFKNLNARFPNSQVGRKNVSFVCLSREERAKKNGGKRDKLHGSRIFSLLALLAEKAANCRPLFKPRHKLITIRNLAEARGANGRRMEKKKSDSCTYRRQNRALPFTTGR